MSSDSYRVRGQIQPQVREASSGKILNRMLIAAVTATVGIIATFATNAVFMRPHASFTTAIDASSSSVAFDATQSKPNWIVRTVMGMAGGATIKNYEWDFGDSDAKTENQTSTGSRATHIYTTSGQHMVTLTVTDNASFEATVKQVIDVPQVNDTCVVNPRSCVGHNASPSA